MQNYWLENKELKFEFFKLKEEIKSKSIPVDNELSRDFCTIMSNVDKSTVPPFIKLFLGGAAKIYFCKQERSKVPSNDYQVLSWTCIQIPCSL